MLDPKSICLCPYCKKLKLRKQGDPCGTCKGKISRYVKRIKHTYFWYRIVELSKGRCLRCHRVDTLTIDHIIPLSVTWNWGWSNLQPLCPKCNNNGKSDNHTDYRPLWMLKVLTQEMYYIYETFRDLEGYGSPEYYNQLYGFSTLTQHPEPQ